MADGSQGARDFDRFTPRWTADMDMRLIAAHGRGETLAQIGADLRVSRNAVAGRVMRLRKAGRIALPPPAPERSEPGPAAPRRILAAADRLGQAPSARLWVQHLDAIGNPPAFAPAVDLALVEGLARGRRGAVRWRWLRAILGLT